jgi:hypothetical protein
VEPGVKVGVGLMKEDAAMLGLGGGSMVGRDVDNDTAGSGMVLVTLALLGARTSLGGG